MVETGELITFWTVIATLGGFLGNLLLVYKRVEAFYIWLFANTAWIAVDIMMGWYEQIPIWAVYQFFAVWAIIKWNDTMNDDVENPNGLPWASDEDCARHLKDIMMYGNAYVQVWGGKLHHIDAEFLFLDPTKPDGDSK